VQQVGLGQMVSAYAFGLRPYVGEFPEDRLLRGSDAWLAMWWATTAPLDGLRRTLIWEHCWNKLSEPVAKYLNNIAYIVEARRFQARGGAPDELHIECRKLANYLERELSRRLTAVVGAARN
jgi:hypothetical protein